MHHFTESLPKDEKTPTELPDRTSTYSPVSRKDAGVSPVASDRVSYDLASPGLHSLRTPDATEKEFTNHSTEKELWDPPALEVVERKSDQSRNRRRRPLLFWIVGLVACLVIGLAIGLGVGLTRK